MKSFQDIIDLWPSIAAFARETGVPYERARRWYNTNSIPHGYANNVVAAASLLGKSSITLELLAKLAEERRSEREPASC